MSALPAVFLPYQQELMASASAHAVTVAEKSRRTGYSWAAAAIGALKAASVKSAGGSDVFYMGYNLEMALEFIDYVAMWAKSVEPAAAEVQDYVFADPDHPERQIKAFRVAFASGYEVVALPSVPRALRGKQGMVIIDEAAFHDALDEVLKAAFALLIWGGQVLIISTHNGDTNPFNVLVQDIRAGRRPYNLLRCTFDDALEQGLYQRICLTTGKTWSVEAEAAWRAEIIAFYGAAADEELFAIPSQSTGSAIPAPLIEKRMGDGIPVVRWAQTSAFTLWAEHLREAECRDFCERELAPLLKMLDRDTPHVFGEDFARSGDLTVIWPLAIGRDLVRRTPFIVELRNVPFEQQRQVLFYVVDRLPRMRAGKLDATGNGQYLGEVALQRYGELRIEAVRFSEPWYRENMPQYKAAFEDGTIVIPRDRDVLDDHRQLAFVRGVIRVPERTLGATDGAQRHGDSAIAGALAYAASRADPELYEFLRQAPPLAKRGERWIDNAEDWAEAMDGRDAGGMFPAASGGMLPTGLGRL